VQVISDVAKCVETFFCFTSEMISIIDWVSLPLVCCPHTELMVIVIVRPINHKTTTVCGMPDLKNTAVSPIRVIMRDDRYSSDQPNGFRPDEPFSSNSYPRLHPGYPALMLGRYREVNK
jgi:hypothetical protein